MDFKDLLAQLRKERDAVDEAIASLERLQKNRGGSGKPRASMGKTMAVNGNGHLPSLSPREKG